MSSKVDLEAVKEYLNIIQGQVKTLKFLAKRNCDMTIYVVVRDGLSFTFRKLLEACGVEL